MKKVERDLSLFFWPELCDSFESKHWLFHLSCVLRARFVMVCAWLGVCWSTDWVTALLWDQLSSSGALRQTFPNAWDTKLSPVSKNQQRPNPPIQHLACQKGSALNDILCKKLYSQRNSLPFGQEISIGSLLWQLQRWQWGHQKHACSKDKCLHRMTLSNRSQK